MMRKEEHLTPDGLRRLQDELRQLTEVNRPQVAERIRSAGAATDNAEYEEAKERQAFVEGRIQELENILANAVVADNAQNPDIVGIGSQVTVRPTSGKPRQYIVVGSAEASPLDGKISHESPVGRALIGKTVGDEVEVAAPSGALILRITQID